MNMVDTIVIIELVNMWAEGMLTFDELVTALADEATAEEWLKDC